MRIVLDSSAIVEGDWNLAHNHAQALLAAGQRGEVELLMPQVVFEEIVAAYGEREAKIRHSLEKTEGELRAMQGARAKASDKSGGWDGQPGYTRHLWKIFLSGGRLLDYPEVDHRLLVTRSLERIPPFDQSGRRGYRDALIWHNVLEVAQAGELLVFVTNDNDFRDNGGANKLHPSLAQDLKDRGIDPQRISLTRSLKETVEVVLAPALDLIEGLNERLAAESSWREAIVDLLMEKAHEEAGLVNASEVDVLLAKDFEPFVEDITEESLEYVDNFRRLAIADAVPLGGSRFGLEVWMEASAFYDITISTQGFYQHPDEVPADLFLSGDEQSAYVSGSANVRLIYELVYDKSEKEISEPRLVRLSAVSDPPPLVLGRWRRTMSSRRKKPRRVNWLDLEAN